jgi:hypothetical protein
MFFGVVISLGALAPRGIAPGEIRCVTFLTHGEAGPSWKGPTCPTDTMGVFGAVRGLS